MSKPIIDNDIRSIVLNSGETITVPTSDPETKPAWNTNHARYIANSDRFYLIGNDNELRAYDREFNQIFEDTTTLPNDVDSFHFSQIEDTLTWINGTTITIYDISTSGLTETDQISASSGVGRANIINIAYKPKNNTVTYWEDQDPYYVTTLDVNDGSTVSQYDIKAEQSDSDFNAGDRHGVYNLPNTDGVAVGDEYYTTNGSRTYKIVDTTNGSKQSELGRAGDQEARRVRHTKLNGANYYVFSDSTDEHTLVSSGTNLSSFSADKTLDHTGYNDDSTNIVDNKIVLSNSSNKIKVIDIYDGVENTKTFDGGLYNAQTLNHMIYSDYKVGGVRLHNYETIPDNPKKWKLNLVSNDSSRVNINGNTVYTKDTGTSPANTQFILNSGDTIKAENDNIHISLMEMTN